ncbi:CPBP family intramembrane metalloprotease [Bacteroidales bacterium OttesenSCG-928-M11]|nr:CPBP family intramembrane metalloprotease [Bacteroidales bacterium OttesenSCG-928-M11]
MKFKGIFKSLSPWGQLVLLLGFSIFGSILFSSIWLIYSFIFTGLTSIEQALEIPSYMRSAQLFSALGMFVFPSLVAGYLFSDSLKEYLSFRRETPISIFLITLFLGIAFIPLINFSYVLNQQMLFPEWMSSIEEWMKIKEEEMMILTERMLYAESVSAFVMNLIVVAVLAGVGEELIFRGVGQNIVQKIVKNPHATIWIVAFIFSAIHLQFYGFLPRFLMGACFGYLLYFTKNIWVPIFAHFVNNAFSVVTSYIYQDRFDQIEKVDTLGSGDTWWLLLVSIPVVLYLFLQIKKLSPIEKTAS